MAKLAALGSVGIEGRLAHGPLNDVAALIPDRDLFALDEGDVAFFKEQETPGYRQ